MMGLDHGISLEPQEFADMVQNIRRVEAARGISKAITPEEKAARLNYHVAVCANRDIKKGEVLTNDDLACKQPLGDAEIFFTGLEVKTVIGMKAAQDLPADTPIPRNNVQSA